MGNVKRNIKNILLVAYTFPPIPYGGTYRSLRLCSGLEKYQIKCHVLTIKEYNDIPNDYTLLKRVPASTVIYRTPIIDPWRRYQVIKNKWQAKSGFKYFNKIVSGLLRLVTFPDHMLFWVPFALIKAKRIIKVSSIDAILVSSPPNSSQLIGLMLKKKYKLKWIADFRDPIFGNVAEVNLINPKDIISKIEKFCLRKYESFIVRNADVLIANTSFHRETLCEQYKIDNVVTIRNSFDPDEFKKCTDEAFGIFTIAHVGSVYGRRSADILLAAIKKIVLEHTPNMLDLQVLFVGQNDKSIINKAKEYGIANYVKIQPQVTHEKAIALMKRSHLLLLIKATGKWSKGQIPGKFFEYAGARRRILCIGPKNSEVAKLIKIHSMGYVVEDNISEMVSALKKEYLEYQNKKIGYKKLSKKNIAQFSSDFMAKSVSELIT